MVTSPVFPNVSPIFPLPTSKSITPASESRFLLNPNFSHCSSSSSSFSSPTKRKIDFHNELSNKNKKKKNEK
jgi:hypothetical protein